jgi:dihydropteroate synthase
MHKDIKIMGIINVNDDSFFAASRVNSVNLFLHRVEKMISEGADIIDIGACSSRPGSSYAGVEEEWFRLEPVLKSIAREFPSQAISIDTFSSVVAHRAHSLVGHYIVNDISAGERDSAMLECVVNLGLGYVAMHMRGNPQTMQNQCEYSDVVEDVKDYFKEFSLRAQSMGLNDWILDPGFGFSKTVEQNHQMLNRVGEFVELGHPVLVGISRKRMVYEPLGLTPNNCLEETCRLHKIAIGQNIDILRVHDVAAAKDLL